jgi:hypothetical protein
MGYPRPPVLGTTACPATNVCVQSSSNVKPRLAWGRSDDRNQLDSSKDSRPVSAVAPLGVELDPIWRIRSHQKRFAIAEEPCNNEVHETAVRRVQRRFRQGKSCNITIERIPREKAANSHAHWAIRELGAGQ